MREEKTGERKFQYPAMTWSQPQLDRHRYSRCMECEVFTINSPELLVKSPSCSKYFFFFSCSEGQEGERGRDKRLNSDIFFSQRKTWRHNVGVMALPTQSVPEKELFHGDIQGNGERILSCLLHHVLDTYTVIVSVLYFRSGLF